MAKMGRMSRAIHREDVLPCPGARENTCVIAIYPSLLLYSNPSMKRICLACCLLCVSLGCRRARQNAATVSEVVLASNAHPDRILRGVYPDVRGWRWTAPVFAFSLDPPPAAKPAYLELDFAIPGELMATTPAVTVVAKVNGVEVVRRTYQQAGRNLLACQVPESALRQRPAEGEFSVDRSITDPATPRLQGLIVVSAGFKEDEQTTEFREAELAKSRQAYQEVIKQRDIKMPVEKQRELMKLFHDLRIWETQS